MKKTLILGMFLSSCAGAPVYSGGYAEPVFPPEGFISYTCDYPIVGESGYILYWNRDVDCETPRENDGEGRVRPESVPEAPTPPEEEKPPVDPCACGPGWRDLVKDKA